MPRFLENALRHEASKQRLTGEDADRYVYSAMNNMGAMHGSNTTAKGQAMERKHERDKKKPATKKRRAAVPMRDVPAGSLARAAWGD